MKLNISETITRQRKQKGLTQERLAEMLGVSAPAVSKWETGASYPDIHLLSPLARALGITVDELLGFVQTLDEQQVNALEQRVGERFRKDFNDGQQMAERLLIEYPNDTYLKLRMAWQLQKWIPFMPEPDEDRASSIIERVISLYEQIHESGDSRFAYVGRIALINHWMSAGRLDEAEELVKMLPDEDEHKRSSMASICFFRGEYEKAWQEQQKLLYSSVSKTRGILGWMSIIAEKQGDIERALELCADEIEFAGAFGLDDYSIYLRKHSLLQKLGRKDEAAQCFDRIIDQALGMKNDFGGNKYFDKMPIKWNNTPNEMQRNLLQLIELDEGCSNPEYLQPIKRLRDACENLV